MKTNRAGILVTCEHGGNRVPRRYRSLFRGAEQTLASHRGWDPGAQKIGRYLARVLEAPFLGSEVTRLLVDLNRTEDRAGLFSEFTKSLPAAERQEILKEYHTPHWSAVEDALRKAKANAPGRRVLHLGSHSFTATPGRISGRNRSDRHYPLGILYDPRSEAERNFAVSWKREIATVAPHLEVRLNQPYRGWSDGMTTAFRRKLGTGYIGIEIECNQAVLARPDSESELRKTLARTLRIVLADAANNRG